MHCRAVFSNISSNFRFIMIENSSHLQSVRDISGVQPVRLLWVLQRYKISKKFLNTTWIPHNRFPERLLHTRYSLMEFPLRSFWSKCFFLCQRLNRCQSREGFVEIVGEQVDGYWYLISTPRQGDCFWPSNVTCILQ